MHEKNFNDIYLVFLTGVEEFVQRFAMSQLHVKLIR